MNAPNTLASLAAAWLAAKADETASHERRIEIEEQIVDLFPSTVEGTDTQEVDGFKVKVTHKVSRSVANGALQKHWDRLPTPVQDCFNWKADLSVAALRRLQENHPELYASAAVFVTSKPAKPAIAIEEVVQ